MNLATRCPACGTVFRVVQDQLRVSEGWVRCGRCDEVFSALKSLFDMDRGGPPPLAEAPRTEAAPEAPPEPEHDATNATRLAPREEPAVPMPLVRPDDMPPAPPPMPPAAPSSETMPAPRRGGDAAVFERPLRTEPEGEPAVVRRSPDAPTEPTLINASRPRAEESPYTMRFDEEAEGQSPAFVVDARSRARWRSSAARPVWVAAAVLLALLLAGQVAFEFRSTLVARWPALERPLARLCQAAGCSLPSPMRLAQLTVDSAALSRTDADGTSRLSVTIRNRGATPVATPSLELSLSDDQGQVVVRRVFLPADYGVRQNAIPAHADLPVQLPLAIAEPRMSGFSVEIFYP